MRARFVHTADNHLGYEQYGVKERFNDFARAFLAIVDDAIARKADFFVVAGDLFNKRAIDARTLMQAQDGLRQLKEAGIPAIAIEGNHDRSYYRDGFSWLQFLCWEGLLVLLDPAFKDGAPVMEPWSASSMRGAYTDLMDGALRVYGLPWYGAGTVRVMEQLAATLRQTRAAEDAAGIRYRVLLMHTGLDGMLPQLHGLPTREQFEPLRGLVDYVALGHVHKPYEVDNWLFNPGSTETWGAEESAWEQRGYYCVDVETDAPEGASPHQAQHLVNPRRAFHRLAFRVDGVPEPSALYDRFEVFCRRQAEERATADSNALAGGPVVDVALTGVLAFDSSAIERGRLEETVTRYFQPLVVRVHDMTRDTDYALDADGEADGRDRTTWHQLELKVFQDLLRRDARFVPESDRWAAMLAELKQMALSGEEPAEIATKLREARTRLLNG